MGTFPELGKCCWRVGWRFLHRLGGLTRKRQGTAEAVPCAGTECEALEGGTDGQAQGFSGLAELIVGTVQLDRLLVAELAGARVREEALEGVARAGVRHRKRLREVLVEAQRVICVEDPEGCVDDRQDDLKPRRHSTYAARSWFRGRSSTGRGSSPSARRSRLR